MHFCRRFVVLFGFIISLVSCASLLAAEPLDWRPASSSQAAMRNMVLYVRDQHGQLVAGAKIIVRERYSYRLVGEVTTNQDGYAQIILNTGVWYVAQAYVTECGSREFWTYKYIGPDDWGSIYPYGEKTLRRDDLWIDQVILPGSGIVPGQPAQVTVSIAHALTQTNFGLLGRMTLMIDDDGQPPYLYENTSEAQLIADGFQPFVFAPKLDQPGDYVVRLILERRFEANVWEVADDGCWSWPMTVAEMRAPLSGVIYLDMNGDNQPNAGEPLAVGALVRLDDAQGDLVAETTSAAQGRFQFDDLPLADYRLRVAELPAGLGRPRPVYAVTLSPETAGQPVMLALDPWRARLPWIIR